MGIIKEYYVMQREKTNFQLFYIVHIFHSYTQCTLVNKNHMTCTYDISSHENEKNSDDRQNQKKIRDFFYGDSDEALLQISESRSTILKKVDL